VAGLLAGCSSSATVIDHASGSSGVAHVGATLDLETASGRSFELTLTQVVDPATPSSGSVKSNKRYVAVLFQFMNTSSHGLAGDSNSDANIVGSNGKLYVPSHDSLKECANATVQYHIAGNGSGKSCVAFLLKKSVTVAQVQFSPAAGTATDYGQWQVP
jgi:hypothetical protein